MNKYRSALLFSLLVVGQTNCNINIEKKHIAFGLGSTLLGGVALHSAAKHLWGKNYPSFFYGILRHPTRVGAFSPCSQYTARALTKYIKQKMSQTDDPIEILEVGGGSGVITQEILRACNESDGTFHVDCVEIDSHYCKLLKKKFTGPNITIHEADIRFWEPNKKYDFIISTIPLMQFVFTDQDVHTILHNYQSWAKDGAIASYVTHVFVPNIALLFLHGKKKDAYLKKMQKIETFRSTYLFDTETVWLNWTPLYVYHMQVTK